MNVCSIKIKHLFNKKAQLCYRRIIELLIYKAVLAVIRAIKVSDWYYLSSVRKERQKSTGISRVVCSLRPGIQHRHGGCMHNILQEYFCEMRQLVSGVVDALVCPVVNLFVWRKTMSLGCEQGTFRQTA